MKPIPKAEITTASLTAYLISMLKLYGVLHWRQYTQGVQRKGFKTKNPMAGFPDIAGVAKNGRLFAAEIKGPGDTMSDRQTFWIANLAANNAIAVVIKSFDDVVDLIPKLIQN